MKRFMYYVAALMMGVTTTSIAYAHTVTSRVQTRHATMLFGGAEVEQETTFSMKKGENTIHIDGLAPYIDLNSLQINLNRLVNGQASTRTPFVISAYEYENNHLSEGHSQTTKILLDSIKDRERQVAVLESKQKANSEMQQLLAKGVEHMMSGEKQVVSSESIEKNLTYYQRRMLQLEEQSRTIHEQKQAVVERLDALRRQLDEQQGEASKPIGTLTLHIQSTVNANAIAHIRYFTSQATWKPFYDIHVSEVGSPIHLITKAQVHQYTGCDWIQVPLTLSTAMPSFNHQVPELSAWRLQRRQRVGRASGIAAGNQVMMMKVADQAAPVALATEEEASMNMDEYVEMNEQPLSEDYNITLPYTLPGNGKQQTITLKEDTISIKDIDYIYRCVPKLDNRVYLTAKLKQWQHYLPLNGKANLTIGNTHLGGTYVNTSSTEETMTLTLGNENRIKSKRETIDDYSRTKIVGSTTTVRRAYRISIHNTQPQAVRVQVEEPYPISGNKEITVDIDSETTRWTKNDSEQGILTYDIHVPAGETQTIIVAYTVKYPKDWQINL